MISRTALILSTLAFCTLATQDANAACKNGVCSLKKEQPRKANQVRRNIRRNKVAAVKATRGCSRCKKAKRVIARNKNGRAKTAAAVCTTGTCPFARK